MQQGLKDFNRCPCQERPANAVGQEQIGPRLGVLRQSCPVLHELLLPDDVWPNYERRAAELRASRGAANPGLHGSILWLAVQRGSLPELLAPLHALLMDGDRVSPEVPKQYRKDLKESWIFESEAIERHRKSRIHQGKLWEILFAWSLHQRGFHLTSLAARGGRADVSCDDRCGVAHQLEMKYIGQPDEEFEMVVGSLAGSPEPRWSDDAKLLAYLRLRAAQAGEQVGRLSGTRVVVLVCARMALFTDDVIADEWATEWQNFTRVEDKTKHDELIGEFPAESKMSSWTSERVEAAFNNVDGVWLCLDGPKYSVSLPCSISR